MLLFQKKSRWFKNLKIINLIILNNIERKSLNGYGAIREKLDEHNTLTVKQPVEVNEKHYQKPILY